MLRNFLIFVFFIIVASSSILCMKGKETKLNFTGAKHEVKLMTLDPGHFHAALVQKIMYDQVSPVVHVFSPEGPDVQDHLKRIDNFNSRSEDPTNWQEIVYTGPDYLEKMISEKPGNVLITSGNNQKKIEYIKAAVDAGINILADKPMCINEAGFELLLESFASAEKNGVLLYDIMTERSEITTILQKELILIPEIFGELVKGTLENPAIVKKSVHHFFKYVAGYPLKRPPWFFDVSQQGEGMVDVTNHLVDLVQWECFPDQILDYQSDIKMINAERRPTLFTPEQFERVTQLPQFPAYLQSKLTDGILPVFCNGDMKYTIKGFHANVVVEWRYQAPDNGGDTHFSVIRGSKSNVFIRQGQEQNQLPELYIEPVKGIDKNELGEQLRKGVAKLQRKYPGIALEEEKTHWHISIPDQYRIGHEAHFGQVTERYLSYLIEGKLPDWEVPNMIAKYYTTTQALKVAMDKNR